MKKAIAIVLLILLITITATAATDYLTAFSTYISEAGITAAKSAMEPQGLVLSSEEYQIFQLGFAFGYDSGLNAEAAESYTFHAPTYIANINSKIFHVPDCYMVNSILFENREDLFCDYYEAIRRGFAPCGKCLKNGPK